MFKQNSFHFSSVTREKRVKSANCAASTAGTPVSGAGLARKMSDALVRRGLRLWALRKRYAEVRMLIASRMPACGATADLDGLLALGREARDLREQIARASVVSAVDLGPAATTPVLPLGDGARPHPPPALFAWPQKTMTAQPPLRAIPPTRSAGPKSLPLRRADGSASVVPDSGPWFCGRCG